MGETSRSAWRFDRIMVLRAYAAFIDALATALVAAPLQWVFFSVDELAMYWLTHAVLHVAMLREFEGTLGMKLLGLVALRDRARPPTRFVALRFILAYGPAIAGFALASRWPASGLSMLLGPILVGMAVAEWTRATMRLGRGPRAKVIWDRLTGIEIAHV